MMAKHGPEETPRPVSTATGTGTLDGTTSAPSSPPPVDASGWADVSLGRRVLRPRTALSFLVAAALVALALSRFDIDPRAVAREIEHANLLFLGLAFAAYYGAFVIRAERWRSLLASADVAPDPGHRMPGIAGLVTIFLLSWFVNCLVPAKLGDAYRGYLLKQRARTPFGSALGTIFAERLADLVMLALLLVASGWLVFGRHMPALVTDWMYVAVAIGAALLVGLVAVYRLRYYLRGLVPHRVRDHYVRVEQGALGSFGNIPFLVGLTAAIWVFEGTRVYL
ncbi:MAG: flippase-like domain-containing protein, partial [Thermomicrobiaceae bacterium]|nr:flippase-like domain-containing protein [Thermomicrobiaceae bacterium]